MPEPVWAFLTTAARLLNILDRVAEGATLHTAQGVLTVVTKCDNIVFFDAKGVPGGTESPGPS